MNRRLCLLLVSLGCLPNVVVAHSTNEETFDCPIDGNQWTQVTDTSGYQSGIRLDLKPLGPTPAPWILPQCPRCRFVLYEEDAAKLPIDKIKAFILSESYQSATKGQPTYFCLGLIEEFLGESPLVIGHAYLKASWQTDSDASECRKHLENALKHFATALASLGPESAGFPTTSILCGELERRIERFGDARKRLEALLTHDAFKEPGFQKILRRELELIAKMDSAPHALDADDETRRK
jgi:hypothetical protein